MMGLTDSEEPPCARLKRVQGLRNRLSQPEWPHPRHPPHRLVPRRTRQTHPRPRGCRGSRRVVGAASMPVLLRALSFWAGVMRRGAYRWSAV